MKGDITSSDGSQERRERNVGTEGKGTKRGGFGLEEAGAVVGGEGEG